MTTQKNAKALVTVLEDLETAQAIIEKLHADGYPSENLELVTTNVQKQAPQIQTPYNRETTADSIIGESVKDAGFGASLGLGAGLIAAVITPFPGVALGMIAIGGLVGGAIGTLSGIDKALSDDSVDLPKVKEYEQLVKDGHNLVVVLGTHDEVTRAHDIVAGMPHIHRHIHKIRGHEFHEHPSKGN